MSRFFHALRQIINGVRPLEDKVKYPFISLVCSLIHISFMLIFLQLHIMPLFYYNIAITIFYLVISFLLVKTKRPAPIFIMTLIEVLVHSVFATVMLGWNWGFMLYTIGLIPMIFYLTYTLANYKGNIVIPIYASAVVVVCYYVMRIYTNKMLPLHPAEFRDDTVTFFYYYNTAITFCILYFFSVFFAIEVQYMRKNLEKENENLELMANYDPLTHLLNRRSMTSCIKQAFAQQAEKKEFCIVMADIDDFKKINDTYGHACGDMVLVTVAKVLSGGVREDDVVCRWGGEEFLILLKAGKDISVEVSERICRSVADTIMVYEGKEIRVTLTLGVAEYQEGLTERSLIDIADERLYYGKRHGKNKVISRVS